jgi:uncharacterized membrane protein
VIAGHFGLATAVKARERSVPLWLLLLGCQWLDVVFVPLFVAGVERIEPLAGTHPGAYGGGVIYADYTHSLVGAVLLSVLFGALVRPRYGRRASVVLALVSFSHWLLDLAVHRADLPLLPGNAGALPRLGFGLWQFPAVSALLELVLVLAGSLLYWRAALDAARVEPALVRRAHVCGAVALASGLVTLGLNLAGM